MKEENLRFSSFISPHSMYNRIYPLSEEGIGTGVLKSLDVNLPQVRQQIVDILQGGGHSTG